MSDFLLNLALRGAGVPTTVELAPSRSAILSTEPAMFGVTEPVPPAATEASANTDVAAPTPVSSPTPARAAGIIQRQAGPAPAVTPPAPVASPPTVDAAAQQPITT